MNTPDVIVAGAGIVGAACAFELAAAGLAVTVVEQGRVAGGTTAAGMGHVVAMDEGPHWLALTRWSRELWARLAADLPADAGYDRCGTLWLAEGDHDLELLNGRAARFRAAGIRTERLDGPALQDAEPHLRPGLAGALRVPDDAVLYPPAAARWLLDRARGLGARILCGASVTQATGDGVRLRDGTRLPAGRVVCAAGHLTLSILERPPDGLGLRPRKGHLAITTRGSLLCRHQLVEAAYTHGSHPTSGPRVAFNVQPRALTDQLLVGSSRQDDTLTCGVDRVVLGRMLRRALAWMPALGAATVLRTWTGHRAAASDELPLIGPRAADPRLLLATGHEGLGITTAPATARLIADAILGRPSPVEPAPFSPDRRSALRDDT